MTSEERYRNDPIFHRLVDTIYAAIEAKEYTASEVRDAAMLAMIRYESTHLRQMWVLESERGRRFEKGGP
jgi:hypothetical protein